MIKVSVRKVTVKNGKRYETWTEEYKPADQVNESSFVTQTNRKTTTTVKRTSVDNKNFTSSTNK